MFSAELMESLTVGNFDYYSASDICLPAPACSVFQMFPSLQARILHFLPPAGRPHRDQEPATPTLFRMLCPAFRAVVVQVTTQLLGADAVPLLPEHLAIIIRVPSPHPNNLFLFPPDPFLLN